MPCYVYIMCNYVFSQSFVSTLLCFLSTVKYLMNKGFFVWLSGGVQSNIKLKRAKSSGTKDRTILSMYNKLTELTALLAELVEIQELTDTIILQVSQ